MKVRTSLICLLIVSGIGVCSIGTAAAQPADAGYKIDPEFTKTSSDGAITIEQEQGYGRLQMAILGAPAGHIHAA